LSLWCSNEEDDTFIKWGSIFLTSQKIFSVKIMEKATIFIQNIASLIGSRLVNFLKQSNAISYLGTLSNRDECGI
jgi:hypothetical protein